MAGLNWVANGTIYVSTFVKIDTTTNDRVIAANNSADFVVGISAPYPDGAPVPTNSNPTVAAVAGESILVYQPGDVCVLLCGSSGWNAGDLLAAEDGQQGSAIAATTGQHYGARAQATCTSGSYGLVRVECGTL